MIYDQVSAKKGELTLSSFLCPPFFPSSFLPSMSFVRPKLQLIQLLLVFDPQLDYEDYEDSEDEGEGSDVESAGSSSPASSTVSFHSATDGVVAASNKTEEDVEKLSQGLGLVGLSEKVVVKERVESA